MSLWHRSRVQDHESELERVLAASSSRRLPIDIRVTLPALRRRYFITFLAGPERRDRKIDRTGPCRSQIGTTKNARSCHAQSIDQAVGGAHGRR